MENGSTAQSTGVPTVGYTDFQKELSSLINCHSQENNSNTPDFVLAEYLIDCLKAFNKATNERIK